MPKPLGSTWPREPFKKWWDPVEPALQPDDYDSRDPAQANAGDNFSEILTSELNESVRKFIDDRCRECNVDGPGLRRLARFALWNEVQELSRREMIQSAVILRENGVPWTALSTIARYKGAGSFKRRWGKEIAAIIEGRSFDREEGFIPTDVLEPE
ncbi:MAG TPA: hypothetical protein VIJ86_09725 [Acidimicrobiales bacterium]